jgi:hypothetical protein
VKRPTADPPFPLLVPVRAHRWEEGAGGLVTVFVPKFSGRFTRRWLMPLLARPDVRLRLDELGSFVWRECDGRTTVADLAERVHRRFGGGPDESLARVSSFVRQLGRTTSVTFLAPVGPAAAGADSP